MSEGLVGGRRDLDRLTSAVIRMTLVRLGFVSSGFWVHCNDSKLNVCSEEEVCRAQAYILFYTQRVTQDKDRPL